MNPITHFLAGWAVVLDYSGVVVLVVLSGYAVARDRDVKLGGRSRWGIWPFAGGVLLSIGVLLV